MRGSDAIPRILPTKRPGAFILQNLDRLLQANNRWLYERIVRSLQSVAYSVCDTVLDAREFRRPQSRRQLRMVGFRRSVPHDA